MIYFRFYHACFYDILRSKKKQEEGGNHHEVCGEKTSESIRRFMYCYAWRIMRSDSVYLYPVWHSTDTCLSSISKDNRYSAAVPIYFVVSQDRIETALCQNAAVVLTGRCVFSDSFFYLFHVSKIYDNYSVKCSGGNRDPICFARHVLCWKRKIFSNVQDRKSVV